MYKILLKHWEIIMRFSNIEKRNFVKDDYNAISELYANEDRNIKLYSPYIDKFIKTLSGGIF